MTDPPSRVPAFEAHSAVVRSGLHALLLTGSRFGAAVLGFALHVILGRVLGVADYGLYALGRSVLEVCNALAKFGFENTLVRFIPKRRAEGGVDAVFRVAITALATVSALGLAVTGVIFLLASPLSTNVFRHPDMENLLRGFALCIIPYAWLGVFGAALRGLRRMRAFAALHDLCFPALHLLLVAIVTAAGLGALGAVAAAFVASLTGALTMLILLVRDPNLRPGATRTPLRLDMRAYPFAMTLLASSLAGAALMPASRLLLGAFESAEQVGLFNAAVLIALQTSLILHGANRAFSPTVAELHAVRDRAVLTLAYTRMTKWIGLASFPLCLLMVVFATQLLSLFGDAFAQASTLLIVLVAGQCINAATGSVGVVLNMTGHHRLELYNRWGMLALAVTLSLILIPRYGALGAALASSAAVILVNMARVIEVYLLEGMQPFSRGLARILTVAVVILLGAALASGRPEFQAIPWPLKALLLLGIYAGAVFAWCLDGEDRKVVEEFMSKVARRR